ncbi:MAG: hypothetical protein EAS48_06685 [Chryseobacterium sp.]|nr:MAG: hypothetical protein EAS48_06685 [Chryseobacterium sp.]
MRNFIRLIGMLMLFVVTAACGTSTGNYRHHRPEHRDSRHIVRKPDRHYPQNRQMQKRKAQQRAYQKQRAAKRRADYRKAAKKREHYKKKNAKNYRKHHR